MPQLNGRYDTDGSAAIDNSELKAAHPPPAFATASTWSHTSADTLSRAIPFHRAVVGYGWCPGNREAQLFSCSPVHYPEYHGFLSLLVSSKT